MTRKKILRIIHIVLAMAFLADHDRFSVHFMLSGIQPPPKKPAHPAMKLEIP